MIQNLVNEAYKLIHQNAPQNSINRVMSDIEVELKLLIANSGRGNTAILGKYLTDILIEWCVLFRRTGNWQDLPNCYHQHWVYDNEPTQM